MSKSDKFLIFTFLLVLLTSVVSIKRLIDLKRNLVPTPGDSSTVRLYRPLPDGNMIYCSGTVVDDVHIITAAHCLTPTDKDILPPTIEIRRADNLPIGVIAQIQAFDPRTDVGILFGDFTTLMHRTALSGAEDINKAFREHTIVICGYPLAGRFTCSKLTDCKNSNFKFSCKGFAYPGMSGGPVVDSDTGNLVAVTSAVNDDEVILSPLVEVWKDLHVDENL